MSKNILLISAELQYTGALNMLLNFTKALKVLNYEAKVISYKAGSFIREFDKLGVSVEIIDENDINSIFVEQKCAGFDMLVANTICTYKFYSFSKNILPSMWYVHESGINLSGFGGIYGIKELQNATKIYAVSPFAKETLQRYTSAKIEILYNCIEPCKIEFKKTKNKKFSFLYLGALEEFKGIGVLVDAFLSLPQDVREVCKLHIIGRKTNNAKFTQELFSKIKSHKNIIYYGEFQNKNKIYKFINKVNIVIQPSFYEAGSLVPLEAAMCAKPMIISKNVGTKYIAQNAGYIVEENSVESLKEAMLEAFYNKQKLEKMGENARENYLKTSTFEVYVSNVKKIIEAHASKTPYEYRMALKDYELYSFDIFDTLITRKCATPQGIFMQMQEELKNNFEWLPNALLENFAKYRVDSEIFLYERYCSGEIEDIKFSEIYGVLANDFGLNESQKKLLMQLELEVENKNIIGIAQNIKLVKSLLVQNKRVALISNMYLSKEAIKGLLANVESQFKDIEIYVSSEFRRHKTNSKLYEIVAQKENIGYDKWLHFGDNYKADFIAPRELGIDSSIYKYESLNPCEMQALSEFKNRLDLQKIVGIARNLRLFNKRSNLFDLGVSFGGILILPYVNWILETAQKQGVKNLIFIARDGGILKTIADKLIKAKSLDFKTHYFYTSRFAWSNCNLASKYTREFVAKMDNFVFIDFSGSGATMAKILDSLENSTKCVGAYYLYHGLTKDSKAPFDKKLFSARRKLINHAFELFCRDLENQTIGYEEKDGLIVPKFSKSGEKEALELVGYGDYLQGVECFVDEILEARLEVSWDIFDFYIDYINRILCDGSDLYLIDTLGNIPFCVDGDKLSLFATRISKEEIDKIKGDELNLITNNIKWSIIRNKQAQPQLISAELNAAYRIKSHLSYRLGQQIVSAKSLKKIAFLPFVIIKTIKDYKQEQRIAKVLYKLNPQLKPAPLETYSDYVESLKIKKHLSYRIGDLILKNPLTFIFKINKTYKEFKKDKNGKKFH
ncbi:MAG: HAD-IA family hydrolase [Helicobacter sp.]|nr:HAD-IA family hydrolase [Helicobacter sp.]